MHCWTSLHWNLISPAAVGSVLAGVGSSVICSHISMERMTTKNMRIYLPFGYISSNYGTQKVLGIKHLVWIYETSTYIHHFWMKSCAALPIGSLKVHMAYTANAMVCKSAQGTGTSARRDQGV